MDAWNTSLSYWVSAYFQGATLLLVSGREIPGDLNLRNLKPTWGLAATEILHVFIIQKESCWWLNQPIWKICASQIGSFPQVGAENKKYLKPPSRRIILVTVSMSHSCCVSRFEHRNHMCAMVKSRFLLGMGDIPPLIGILIMDI